MKWFIVISLFIFSCYASAKTFCIAHRGHHQNFTENSLGALHSALKIGSDGVEFDVAHTKDGMPIIMHDLKLGETTTSRAGYKCPEKKIAKLTWKEIQTKCLLKNGEEIPNLMNFLSALDTTSVFVFIEFKDLPHYHTLQIIDRYLGATAERVRFTSFHEKFLDQAYSYAADFPSLKKIKGFYNYRFFFRPKSNYGLNTRFSYGRTRRMMKSKYEQFERGVWTVDDPGNMIWSDFMQVNFLTTNQPELCLRLIRH
ncbi:MAG: hypothetical protein HYV97_10110 [Bdellovibrio sp.]|nr:hypothetical protein [Bdellovibrio sp.]